MKIAVYAIAKNEANFIERFLASAEVADEIIIADTGSTDDTLASFVDFVQPICITPWRFDLARNASLALVSRDIDVCICLDLDEVLEPGWRAEIERVWTPETTRLRYGFDYSGGIQFRSEKIHSRKGYFWKYACHEILEHDPRIQEVWAETSFQLIKHIPDPEKPRSHYLELLKVTVDENPNDLRSLLYYGRELFFAGRYAEAFYQLVKYDQRSANEWEHERAWALRLLGECCWNQGDQVEALRFFEAAIFVAPKAREPLIDLAEHYYRLKNWPKSLEMATKALQITERQHVYTENADAWGWKPHDLIAIAAFRLGNRELARQHGEIAVELKPDDPRLQQNLGFYIGPTAVAAE